MKREIIETFLSVFERALQQELDNSSAQDPAAHGNDVVDARHTYSEDLAAKAVSEICKLDRYERRYAAERDRRLRKSIRTARRRR